MRVTFFFAKKKVTKEKAKQGVIINNRLEKLDLQFFLYGRKWSDG